MMSVLKAFVEIRDPDRCPVTVNNSGSSRWASFAQCPRKPKADKVRPVFFERQAAHALGDGTIDVAVCGLHANQYDKAEAKDRAWRAEADASDQARADAEDAIARLADFGLKGKPEYIRPVQGGMGKYSGNVVVSPTDLLRLLSGYVAGEDG